MGDSAVASAGKGMAADRVHSWEGAWPGAPDVAPNGRCQFVLSPPRHFLYPALLLLLAEEPRHGYLLVDALNSLGLGRMDRPSVYRALAELERDGLVRSWDEAPTAGSTRHVHAVTRDGQDALEAWMSIVAQERNSLDVVLERYWYCNARRLGSAPVDAGAPTGAEGQPAASNQDDEIHSVSSPTAGSMRFKLNAERSNLVVEARSNVGLSPSALPLWPAG